MLSLKVHMYLVKVSLLFTQWSPCSKRMESLFRKYSANCHTPAKLRPKPSWVGCIIGFDKPKPKNQSLHILTSSTVPRKLIFSMQPYFSPTKWSMQKKFPQKLRQKKKFTLFFWPNKISTKTFFQPLKITTKFFFSTQKIVDQIFFSTQKNFDHNNFPA